MKSSGAVFRGMHAGALAFTVFFSLYPREAVDLSFSAEVQRYDWLFHTLCYFALAALHLVAYPPPARPDAAGATAAPTFRRLRTFALYSLLGLALEAGQALPAVHRSCSVSDALHNAFGAALGALLAPPWRFVRARSK